MDKKSEKFLGDYLNNPSPTGFEAGGQKIWMNYLKPFADQFITDVYGSAVAVINPGQSYKVVIEAHADEISWFVNYISKDGFIYVKRNGGSDALIAPAKRVNIFTDKGIVKGVFGWPAIHIRNSDTKPEFPKVDNIFIDVGASSKEEVTEMGIYPGTVLTFEDGFSSINDKYYMGRALDNRMGGFMIAEVARRLAEKKVKLPFTLFVVNSVQEEVGLRGAQMIAQRLNPDLAIITDVTHDTNTPMIEKIREGDVKCGEGPSLTVGPAVQNKLLRAIRDTAEKHKIKYQMEAASRSTGTDTDAFAYSNQGVASALISLPLRYMHTTVEMVAKSDVEACIDLMYEFLKGLKSGTSFSYFD
ncbi:MAG: M42 family metallopeptidase [Bacteroidia bacterium]|nr:M42 family metallopeptidase [Bacteroidia bacterium]